jgi:hypothetical protein
MDFLQIYYCLSSIVEKEGFLFELDLMPSLARVGRRAGWKLQKAYRTAWASQELISIEQ